MVTFGASVSVFVHGCFSIDAEDRANREKPGEAIGEFFLYLIFILLPYRSRQFADFFDEPVKGFVESSCFVFLEIDILDEFLIFP